MALTIAAFSGSLRKESFTTKLVKAFQKQAPKGVEVRLVAVGKLPLFNEDLEANLPQTVKALHAAVQPVDAVLLATPEYNRSYSPVLKNALDWGSRPYGQNVWDKKPAGVISCTPYNLGGFGAHHHLRQVLTYLNMYTMQQPEFYLEKAGEKFDDQGQLIDEPTREYIDSFWANFIDWIERVKT